MHLCAQGLNQKLVPSRDNEILLINISRPVKPWNSNASEYTLMCIYLYHKLCNLFQWETFPTTSTVNGGQKMRRQGCCSMVSRLLLLGTDLTQQAWNCSYCYCRWLFHQLSGQITPLGKSWGSEVPCDYRLLLNDYLLPELHTKRNLNAPILPTFSS